MELGLTGAQPLLKPVVRTTCPCPSTKAEKMQEPRTVMGGEDRSLSIYLPILTSPEPGFFLALGSSQL